MKIENKNESGLPDIAREQFTRNRVAMILIGIVLIIVLGTYFYTKPNRKVVKPGEESYEIQRSSELENKNESVIFMQKKDEEKPRQVDPEVLQQQLSLIQEKQKALQQRLTAPLMLVNESQANQVTGLQKSQVDSSDPNTQFMHQVSAPNTQTENAKTVGPLNYLIAEGNFIHAILESATNSDLPGHLRAIVSEPVYAEDGSQILIPQGSRLIGQYKSGMLQGQSRIFVVWSRLITPVGLSVNLGSPGVDSLGVAGDGADEINRHFWQRFGTASLLSLIGASAANLGVNAQDQANSVASYRAAVSSSFSQAANQSLQQESAIAPTLQTYQGKPVMVFVAKDINFQNAIKQIKPAILVF